MPEISQQNVIVTGANRGIGRVIAEQFADHGAHVGVLGRREEAVEETVTEIREKHDPAGKLSSIVADVSSADQVHEAIGEWADRNEAVHTLINNAGITRDGLLMTMKSDDWEDVLKVNLDGAFHCAKAVIRPMMKNRWGRILMVSSIVGLTGNAGQSNYSASKAGLVGLSKSIAKELGSRNITSNTIAPGYIDTEMTEELDEETRETLLENTPVGRLGEARDIAELALFLASEKASFISGEIIRVDGGLAM